MAAIRNTERTDYKYVVTKDWTKLFDPKNQHMYLYNGTGITVRIVTTDKELHLDTLNQSKYFTLGGSIGQYHVSPNKYVYASLADSKSDAEAVIIGSDSLLSSSEQSELKEHIVALGVEVMHLSNRVTTGQVSQRRHLTDYELMIREFLDSTKNIQTNVADLYYHIFRLSNRLLTVERYVFEHRSSIASLASKLAILGDVNKLKMKIDTLDMDLGAVSNTVTNINNKLNDLIPKVEEGWQDFNELITEHIDPLKEQVEDLNFDFRDLNNAMVELVSAHTPTEIENAFVQFIKHVDDDMVDPITALKNFLVDLAWKMDYRHPISLEMSMTDYASYTKK